jgi:predicted RNA-binding Zn-ribbon protein involved in translation (DUF1610 family)
VAEQYCPECGERMYRSSSHNLGERVIKLFSAFRTYRCSACGWRGWLRYKGNSRKSSGPRARIVVLTMLAFLALALLALYLVGRLTEIATP